MTSQVAARHVDSDGLAEELNIEVAIARGANKGKDQATPPKVPRRSAARRGGAMTSPTMTMVQPPVMSEEKKLEEMDIEQVCAELAADLEELEKDKSIKQALEKGQVRDMAKEVESELREVESSSVRDYMQQSSQVVDLHNEMQKCDGILAKMQEMLLGFDADLESVSSDIRQLQKESRRMKAKLANRKDAEGKLRDFLDAFAVSPTLPATICDGDVDDHFAAAVAELDARLSFVKRKSQENPRFATYAAARDVGPALEKLKIKACAKCREYLAEKISVVRKLDTNVEMARTSALCKFSSLYAFVDRHAPDVAVELRDYYVDSMAKAFAALFKAYNATLAKFDKEVANKHDLICVQEAAVRSQFTTKVSLSKRGDAFSLADRVDVLNRWRSAPPVTASHSGDRFPFDELFRSAVRHLIDAVLNEIDFVSDFFVVGDRPMNGEGDREGKDDSEAKDGGARQRASPSTELQKRRDTIVARVFGKAASAVLDHLESKLFQCHDIVGLFLVAKIVAAARREMTTTGVLDAFFDHCDSLLKPRLATLFAANIDAARRADPGKLGVTGVMPHYVSRRYAELAATTFALFPEGKDDEKHGRPARGAMADLRKEVTNVLERVARSFSKEKQSIIFLVNNYDAVLTILKERRRLAGVAFKSLAAPLSVARGTGVPTASVAPSQQPPKKISEADQSPDMPEPANPGYDAEMQYFDDRLARQRELFVETELLMCFPKLMKFVKDVEPTLTNHDDGTPKTNVDSRQVERLVRDFAATWKSAIEKVHKDVLASFANFINGMELLKQVLTQLLLYYTRFQEIIKKTWRRQPPFAKDLVPTSAILAEIKKYSRVY